MPSTKEQGFRGHMQQVLQLLAVAELEPDAPPGAVQSIRQSVIGVLQSGQQGGGLPPGGGMPVQPGLQSRGPTPGMDQGPMAQDLAAAMMGGGQQGQPQGQPPKPGMPPQ